MGSFFVVASKGLLLDSAISLFTGQKASNEHRRNG